MPEYAGPKRLRQLLNAVLAVAADLDLATVLQHLVESAVELVDARYGALGVLDETGTEPEPARLDAVSVPPPID